MPLSTGPSSAAEPSPHAISSADCTINIAGYSIRKGQAWNPGSFAFTKILEVLDIFIDPLAHNFNCLLLRFRGHFC